MVNAVYVAIIKTDNGHNMTYIKATERPQKYRFDNHIFKKTTLSKYIWEVKNNETPTIERKLIEKKYRGI